jgi:hypothetical protein
VPDVALPAADGRFLPGPGNFVSYRRKVPSACPTADAAAAPGTPDAAAGRDQAEFFSSPVRYRVLGKRTGLSEDRGRVSKRTDQQIIVFETMLDVLPLPAMYWRAAAALVAYATGDGVPGVAPLSAVAGMAAGGRFGRYAPKLVSCRETAPV